MADLRIKFWGVRGSYPTPQCSTLAYGGHTSCVTVEAGGHFLIFDAGTGIIPLGKTLVKNPRRTRALNLFLSHTHHDHIFGFYFFAPLFRSGMRVAIFGPRAAGRTIKETLHAAMAPRFFPVGPDRFKAGTHFYSLGGNEDIRLRNRGDTPMVMRSARGASLNEVQVLAHRSDAHPNGVLVYRVSHRGKSLVYATDIEQTKTGCRDIIDFIRGADLLIHDGQYLEKEYLSLNESRRGWGHSTVERAARVARSGAVKRLILFHHDPTHNDTTLKRIEAMTRLRFPSTVVAREGLEIAL